MAKKTAEKKKRGTITVYVSDFTHGLRVFEHIQLIRIKSVEHTLLIMEDYYPVLGRVQGLVELVSNSDLNSLGQVSGFYMHRNNEFTLLIKAQLEEEPGKEPPHEQ